MGRFNQEKAKNHYSRINCSFPLPCVCVCVCVSLFLKKKKTFLSNRPYKQWTFEGTNILHNELVAYYKLIYLNCVHLSDNKLVSSSINNIFWHKLLNFLKIVEQRWNSKRCKIKAKIHYEGMMQRAKNSISKRQKNTIQESNICARDHSS